MKSIVSILSVLAATTLVCACGKTTQEFVTELQNGAITFKTGTMSSATRADGAGHQNHNDIPVKDASGSANSFISYAYLATGTAYIDGQSIKYYNAPAGKDNAYAADTWHAEPLFFWPKGGNQLTFYAWTVNHLASQTADSYFPDLAGVTCSPNNGIKFAADMSNNAGLDILVAEKAQSGSNTVTHSFNGIPTLFRHVCSKVGFTVKQDKEYYQSENSDPVQFTVKGITLENVLTKGEYEQGSASPVAMDCWSNQSTPQTLNPYSSTSGILVTTVAQSAGDSFVAIPQGFDPQSSQASIEVSYTVKTWNGSSYITYDATSTISMDKVLTTWNPNKDITICIVFKFDIGDPTDPTTGSELIYFDPAVQDWDTESYDGEINI